MNQCLRVSLLCLTVCLTWAGAAPAQSTLALAGGTIIDVSAFGHSTSDIRDSVVLMRDGQIVAVGARDKVSIPPEAQVIDVTGKFILPGLVDGFAGLNSQSQANAYLYMGVTTVVGSGDDRRGHLFLHANPGPHLYLLDGTGSSDDWDLLADKPEWSALLKGHNPDVELTWEQSNRMMDEQKQMGVRGLWLGHNLTADNVQHIVAKARELGLATYGEFTAAPYAAGIADGVSLLLHMTRYELGLASPELLRNAARDPEGAGGKNAYDSVDKISPDDPRVAAYAKKIAAAHVALMPTFSLYYALLPDHRNVWQQPAAKVLDPKDVFHPVDRETGEVAFRSDAQRQSLLGFVAHMWALNVAIAGQHPRYLAASGGAVFSSLPGISMHTELELLVRVGLTRREALAAATGNYAEQLGWTELGRIAAGRRADLLVLDANPLDDIRNSERIQAVILDGRIVDRDALLK